MDKNNMEAINSLYIHFPFCRHLCNYCDFYKTKKVDDSSIRDYETLLNQMFLAHDKFITPKNLKIDSLKSLYIGGGTPSLWGAEGARYLDKTLKSQDISLLPDCEFTLEVNPGAWSNESLATWQSVGANRFSLGIQTLDGNLLKIIDRVHGVDDVYLTLNKFKDMKADFSVDFMIGLPFSDKYERDIIGELKEILTYNPGHISLYILTVPKHYKHYKELPTEEWVSEEYKRVSEYLRQEGFNHYEVSNFAKPGRESVHNMEYWKMNSVAALGPSATGFLKSCNNRYKWKTTSVDFVLEELTDDEFNIEKLYMNLRSSEGFLINTPAWGDLGEYTEKMKEQELCTVRGEMFYLTPKGFLFLDSIMNEIFRISS